ncbi:MAG: hypothetical protein ACI4S3_02085 [Candidatus Gastranaerophilaceae bacterium]
MVVENNVSIKSNSKQYSKDLRKTELQVDNKPSNDKGLSNATKMAIGATALAAIVVAGLGIAGHKGVGPLKNLFKKQIARPDVAKLPSFSSRKEEFLAAIKKTEFIKPSSIPDDIPAMVDFSKGRTLEIKNSDGIVIRKYISEPDKKTIRGIIDYDPKTKKPRKILKYAEGKLYNICDCNEKGYEIKRTVFWHGTDKLKGIVTKGKDGKELTVKFKENGTDLDYVHNLSSDFGEVNSSIKF